MWDILPCRIAFVPIPPSFIINDKPRAYYDKFPAVDDEEFILNTLLRGARLNTTVEESNTAGECLWINKTTVCTGIMKMLKENQTDASILATTLTVNQDENLFSDLKFGSFNSEDQRVFLSTFETEAKNASVNPYDITKSIPWSVLLLQLVILVIVMMLINYKLTIRDKRLSFLDTILLQIFVTKRDYRVFRRKILYLFFTGYCFFSFCFISTCIDSELVVDIPARYLTSLESVLASNRSIGMLEGYGLMQEIQHSQGKDSEVKKKLLKRAQERNTLFKSNDASGLINIAMASANDRLVALMDSIQLANGVKNIYCMSEKETDPDKIARIMISQPFSSKVIGNYFSKYISNEVAYRFALTTNRMHQSGLMVRMQWKSTSDTSLCMFLMDLKKHRRRNHVGLQFKVFDSILLCFLFSLIISFLGFYFEQQVPWIHHYIMSLSLQQQNKYSIKWLKFCCKIFTPRNYRKNYG